MDEAVNENHLKLLKLIVEVVVKEFLNLATYERAIQSNDIPFLVMAIYAQVP